VVWFNANLGKLFLAPAPEDAGRMVDIVDADALGLADDVIG
jgi:hypothetical protein